MSTPGSTYKLHHVGYVTSSIAASRALHEDMGFTAATPVYHDPIQQVRIVFMATGADVLVELVEPAGEGSSVSDFLKKHGSGLNHLCYEVDDIERECASMREKGGIITVEPMPAVAFDGRRIAFVCRRDGLIELLERAR